MERNELLTIVLKMKHLADIFERIEITPDKQTDEGGAHATTENQFCQDKELLNEFGR